jgi:hypothetical protein
MEAKSPETVSPDTKPETKDAAKLRVRTGVRAGLEGTWKLGNKEWNDDWLAPK